MDFKFTEEEEKFREEVRELVTKELPKKWGSHLAGSWAGVPWGDPELEEEHERVVQKLVKEVRKRGWRPLSWPKELGGFGASIWQEVALKEECGYWGAPSGGGLGELFIGPAILRHGTEEQKKKHIPPICAGRDRWCELYSEPNHGSDLAAIETRAVEDGDYYIINGQKTWTSSAPEAEWGMLVARTDPNLPRHRGISCFLLDMKTPGVKVEALKNMIRQYDISNVWFDNVRIHKSNMLGEKNKGWYAIMSALGFERGGTLDYSRTLRILDKMVEYCKKTRRDGKPLSENPVFRQKIAACRAKIDVTRLINYSALSLWAAGKLPDYEASLGKIFMDTVYQEVIYLGMEILGPLGRVQYPDKYAAVDGAIEFHMRPALHQTISPGTLEIQKHIIATRGLGLPRGW